MSQKTRRPVVIDIGTGYTKMGLAGNIEPQFIIPTCVANSTKSGGAVHTSQSQGNSDTNFYIGEEAYARKTSMNYALSYPVSKGRIENWDDIERFLHQALYRNLRVVPEEHLFCMTETPFNSQENKERLAEIMFETFNVKGMHLGTQAVFALVAKEMSEGKTLANLDLTGLVIDAGDGQTQVIPVADGYVIPSGVQELPVGGKQVTDFIAEMLTDRGEPVPAEVRMEAARQININHSYLCKDVVDEYAKYDKDPAGRFKQHSGENPKTKEKWTVTVGYERFLAPELFFNPEIFSETQTLPLPKVVDACIQSCPIDYKRRLYSNIVVAGGSSSFLHFKERLERDVQSLVDERLIKRGDETGVAAEPLPVKVYSHKRSACRYAAWLGASLWSESPVFERSCKLKQDYDEIGPACMRTPMMLMGAM
eukprot:TRINITY_DN36412_c0_g1_i1.p1 TRINITY_DN36412_c0_g1~~TRINITY_DN36412_c0_g1_i1.p1  ORF type:complete len:423 (+),score=74.71 TRINITY_DN36412_c0_g1_i1:146-1414(+)